MACMLAAFEVGLVASKTRPFLPATAPLTLELSWVPCRLVVAFEVDLAEVCGLDYVWRLCEDGRLVLEARQVVKREFLTARRPGHRPASTHTRCRCAACLLRAPLGEPCVAPNQQ